MTFRIKARDFLVEVDTKEEFLTALKALKDLDKKGSAHISSANLGGSVPRLIESSTEEKLSDIFKYIQSEPRGGMMKLIKILASTSEWVTSESLQKELKGEGSGMGGTIGAITRKAKAIGLKTKEIISREETKEGIRYRLTPAMRELVKSEFAKEQTM